MPNSMNPRRATAALAAIALAALCASGCSADSPPEQQKRLDKAAGLAEFKVTCTKDMWDRTRKSGLDKRDDDEFDKVKPVKLGGDQGKRGLIQVTLTGPQLVEYLRKLDYDAHDGPLSEPQDEPLARRMYDAIAPVVDHIKQGRPPQTVPQAVVDDAVASAPSATPAGKT
ncbi:hypothetical protein [Streptomyces lydicus]|uniref:hypothetical protein n=1 Tax=Streptomyces lydicus TaxID=47763 RepID=UPI001010334B|nr:hypothetical protein [Streptomyces lydicus]MCZ1012641.1 hypothetical protein [Streptomyces lydicus]